MKLVDVNILIYSVDSTSVHHQRVATWWETALNGEETVAFAWLTLLGFLRISTNPRAVDVALTISEALTYVDDWLARPQTSIVGEMEDHWQTFKQLLTESGTAGNRTTDAHLAALAISHNATLVSCDTDFARFRNLRWENPLTT